MVVPLRRRWARFGPSDARWFSHIPEDGVCLSTFLFVRDRHGGVLIGRPRPHLDWPEKGCMPLWRLRQVAGHGEWVLPASHLLMEEAPDRSARRIAREWAGLPRSRPTLVGVTSERMPTGRWRREGARRVRRNHWAVCFLYELRTQVAPRRARGWAAIRFASPTELGRLRLGRGHSDLLREYLRLRAPR